MSENLQIPVDAWARHDMLSNLHTDTSNEHQTSEGSVTVKGTGTIEKPTTSKQTD